MGPNPPSSTAAPPRAPQFIADLGEPHVKHAVTIAGLKARSEASRSAAQRTVERITEYLGKPGTIAVLVVGVGLWISWNAYCITHNMWTPDPPPFYWLQGVTGMYAALMTTFILARQNREKHDDEARASLDLHINLLAEEKVAKIIGLLEELRRDLPMVKNRSDVPAETLQMPADADVVIETLHELLENPKPL